MSEAVLTNALVPFYSTKRSGTGLGLALARRICDFLGAGFAYEARAGGGSRFILSFPDDSAPVHASLTPG